MTPEEMAAFVLKIKQEADEKVRLLQEEVRRVNATAEEKVRKAKAAFMVPPFLHELDDDDYTSFVESVYTAVEEWKTLENITFLFDWKKLVKHSVLKTFRRAQDGNEEGCTVSACSGDVQSGKSDVTALIAFVIHFIHKNRQVADEPYTTVIVDNQSSRDAMIPKLKSKYNPNGDVNLKRMLSIQIDNHKERKAVAACGGIVIVARTCSQIDKATPDIEDDAYWIMRNNTYVVLDEADNLIGSTQGLQQYEQALDRFLKNPFVCGATLLSATVQHAFFYLLKEVCFGERHSFEFGSIDAFHKASHIDRQNYIGLDQMKPFQEKFLTNGGDNNETRVGKDTRYTCPAYLTLCEEVLKTPRACLMSDMCSGVNHGTSAVNMTQHCDEMYQKLIQQAGGDVSALSTAVQIIIHGASTIYGGTIGFRFIGNDCDARLQQLHTDYNCMLQRKPDGFIEINELKEVFKHIDDKASQKNPTHVRLCAHPEYAKRPLNLSHLGLLMYVLRKNDPELPMFLVGHTVMCRSVSLVSVNPLEPTEVIACVTHAAVYIPENKGGFISANHSNTVQKVLRPATTLRQFHDKYGFADIPILTQRNVWNVLRTSAKCNDWMCDNQSYLTEQLSSLPALMESIQSIEDDKETMRRIVEHISLQNVQAELIAFFQGKNWGNRRAEKVCSFTTKLFIMAKVVAAEERGDNDEAIRIWNEFQDEWDEGVLEKRDESKPRAKKRKGTKRKNRSKQEVSYENLKWFDNIIRGCTTTLDTTDWLKLDEILQMLNGTKESVSMNDGQPFRIPVEMQNRAQAIPLVGPEWRELFQMLRCQFGQFPHGGGHDYPTVCKKFQKEVEQLYTREVRKVKTDKLRTTEDESQAMLRAGTHVKLLPNKEDAIITKANPDNTFNIKLDKAQIDSMAHALYWHDDNVWDGQPITRMDIDRIHKREYGKLLSGGSQIPDLVRAHHWFEEVSSKQYKITRVSGIASGSVQHQRVKKKMKKSHSVKKNTASKKRKLTPMQPLEDVTTSSMNAIARAQSAKPTQ